MNPNAGASEPKSFSSIYRLAVELVRFRAALERCYAHVLDWPPDERISPPVEVGIRYGPLKLVINEMGAGGGNWDALQALSEAATSRYALFGSHWLDAEHCARLDARLELIGRWGDNSDALDWRVVAGRLWHPPEPPEAELRNALAQLPPRHLATPSTFSRITAPQFLSPETTHVAHPRVTVSPFAAESWVAYEGATSSFLDKLPDGHRSLFLLVTRMAEVRYPYPNSYDPRTGTFPAHDPDALSHLIAYSIAQYTIDVQSMLGCLMELPPRWPTEWLRATICERLDTVGELLNGMDDRRPATGREPLRPGKPNLIGPWYDETSRTLYYQGRCARKFAPQAKVTEQLAKFQLNLWRDPVKVGDNAAGVVRALNTNLCHIEFSVSPEGNDHIDWREATPQTDSTPTAE